MLFETTFAGASPDDALSFIVEILQSFTEYSIIGKDLNGRILLWNEGARRLYGYEPEEVIGRAQADILHTPEDIAAGKPAAILQEALRRGKWEGLLTRLRKNGSRFVTRAVATPRFDTGGLHTGYPRLRPVPFVLITSSMIDEKARINGLALGATRFLCRPIEPELLLAEIRACLAEKGDE